MLMPFVEEITTLVEPLQDEVYGPLYRCALTLKDGTYLPCAIIQSRERLVANAKEVIGREMSGSPLFSGPDPFGNAVSSYLTYFNRVSEHEVLKVEPSRYAIPKELLAQIGGETAMGWTGWVFRMKDGRAFSYGTTYRLEFFQLPDGYEFSDVVEVINHSFVDADGRVVELRRGALPDEYRRDAIFRERPFFICAVDEI